VQKIVPFLWFDDQAEEAMNHYVSIFPDSRVIDVARYGEGGPGPAGTAMMATFELAGQRFMALNGGPLYRFTEAISLYVECRTQEEVDTLWARLSEGGSDMRCGWLKDRYGLSWQVIPSVLGELLHDPDPARAGRVMQAMMGMQKLDIDALKRAHRGDGG